MRPHPNGYNSLPIHFNGDDNECEGSLNRAIRRHDIYQHIDASIIVYAYYVDEEQYHKSNHMVSRPIFNVESNGAIFDAIYLTATDVSTATSATVFLCNI